MSAHAIIQACLDNDRPFTEKVVHQLRCEVLRRSVEPPVHICEWIKELGDDELIDVGELLSAMADSLPANHIPHSAP